MTTTDCLESQNCDWSPSCSCPACMLRNSRISRGLQLVDALEAIQKHIKRGLTLEVGLLPNTQLYLELKNSFEIHQRLEKPLDLLLISIAELPLRG